MPKIIIAEDHEVLMDSLRQMILEEFPTASIETVSDTNALLERVLNDHWDLVISDLSMPGGGGFFALRKIKLEKKDLPVIITSTYPAEQYADRVIRAGAAEYISKDSLSTSLITAIRRIIQPG